MNGLAETMLVCTLHHHQVHHALKTPTLLGSFVHGVVTSPESSEIVLSAAAMMLVGRF